MVVHIENYVTGDPAFAVDMNGTIRLWNPGCSEVLGYDVSDAVGRQCWQLLNGRDTWGNQYCCEHCPLRTMARQRRSIKSFHATFESNAGERKPFAVSCLTVYDEPGSEILIHTLHHEELDKREETTTVSRNGNDADTPVERFAKGSLSPRESEVIEYLAEGHSTRHIAELMGVSVRTVRTHIQHTLYKLGAHTRRDAIKRSKRLKLI